MMFKRAESGIILNRKEFTFCLIGLVDRLKLGDADSFTKIKHNYRDDKEEYPWLVMLGTLEVETQSIKDAIDAVSAFWRLMALSKGVGL